mgnify:CR=1 FL=1
MLVVLMVCEDHTHIFYKGVQIGNKFSIQLQKYILVGLRTCTLMVMASLM